MAIITYSTDRSAAESGSTLLANTFILEYLKDAPDTFVKVYLFAIMQNQNAAFINDDLALCLNLDDNQVAAAFEYWQKKGLVKVLRNEPLHIEFLKPNRLFEVQNGKYEGLIKSLREVLGTRLLTPSELKCIYDWIEIFGLTEDAVLALFMYCIENKGIRVSIRYIDEVAKTWADHSVLTADDAREYIARHTAFHKGAGDIIRRFGLKRNPTDDEVELYKKWVSDYKLTPSAIEEACVGMTKATNPSFAYLDKIIAELHEKGAVDEKTLSEYRKQQILQEEFAKDLFLNAGIKRNPTSQEVLRIESWQKEYHLSKEMLILLAKKSKEHGKPFAFICKRVEHWNENNIRNIDDAKADLEKPLNQKVSLSKTNFTQRKYNEEDFKKLIKYIDED